MRSILFFLLENFANLGIELSLEIFANLSIELLLSLLLSALHSCQFNCRSSMRDLVFFLEQGATVHTNCHVYLLNSRE